MKGKGQLKRMLSRIDKSLGRGVNQCQHLVVEKNILEMFENNKNDIQAMKVFKSFEYQYHLSDIRENLLKWFPFNTNFTLLEIGSECGALTGLFCKRVRHVTAIEANSLRALVTAVRHSGWKNLRVLETPYRIFEEGNQFEYIAAIGNPAYQVSAFCEDERFETFLLKLQSLLKPNGVLLLTCDSGSGVKLACRDKANSEMRADNLKGSYLLNHELAYKRELKEVLRSTGFSSLDCYYAFPNYVFPMKVVAEELFQENKEVYLKPHHRNGTRFREDIDLRKDGEAVSGSPSSADIKRSSLIVARKDSWPVHFKVLSFSGANRRRKREFRICASIAEKHGKKVFIKYADNDHSVAFLEKISMQDEKALRFFKNWAKVITGNLIEGNISYPFVCKPTLEDMINKSIKYGDPCFGIGMVEEYVRFIERLPSKDGRPEEFIAEFGLDPQQVPSSVRCLLYAPIDCIPRNILVDGKEWSIIDNEWNFDFPMPIDFLVFRGIYSLIINLQDSIQGNITAKGPGVLFSGYGRNRTYIPASWLGLLQERQIPTEYLYRWEGYFKQKVFEYAKVGRLRLKGRGKPVHKIAPISGNTDLRGFKGEDRLQIMKIRFEDCVRKIARRLIAL